MPRGYEVRYSWVCEMMEEAEEDSPVICDVIVDSIMQKYDNTVSKRVCKTLQPGERA